MALVHKYPASIVFSRMKLVFKDHERGVVDREEAKRLLDILSAQLVETYPQVEQLTLEESEDLGKAIRDRWEENKKRMHPSYGS